MCVIESMRRRVHFACGSMIIFKHRRSSSATYRPTDERTTDRTKEQTGVIADCPVAAAFAAAAATAAAAAEQQLLQLLMMAMTADSVSPVWR